MNIDTLTSSMRQFVGRDPQPRGASLRLRAVPLPRVAFGAAPAVDPAPARDDSLNPEIVSLGELRAERFVRRAVARPRTASRITLEVIAGPHEGLQYESNRRTSLVIGRSRAAKLRLKRDLHLSRHHFLLKFDGKACRLIDLESLNGTRVNDVSVHEATLKSGDIISLGKTRILVSIVR